MSDAPTPPLISEKARQADPAMRGYYYQVLQSALAWVQLEPHQTLYLETAEDFDVVAKGRAITTQVKDTKGSGSITLRSTSVVEAISNYWGHVIRNPDKDIVFRYLTTSSVGKEKNAPFGDNVKGIELWQRASEDDAQKIKDFLVEDNKVSAELRSFLECADAAQVLQKLINPVRFYPESPALPEIQQELRHHLILYGNQERVRAVDAIRVLGELIDHLYVFASKPEKRALRITDFYLFFSQATSVNISYQRHEMLLALEQMQTNDFRNAAVASSQSFQIDECAGPHDTELKEIKSLIDGFNTGEALRRLTALKASAFAATAAKVRHRILIYTGICHLRHGQLDEGHNLFVEALQYDPNHPLALSNAAFGAAGLGRSAEAEEYLRRATAADETEPYIYAVRINIAPKETPLDELAAWVPIALKHAEKINFALGYAALNRDMLEQAVHYFELTLAVNKNDIETQGTLGSTLLKQLYEHKERLIAEELDPHSSQVLERIVHLLQGAWDAIARADHAAERLSWLLNLMQAYRQQKKYDKAQTCIDLALSLRPNENEVHKFKAILCFDQKDLTGAIVHTLKLDEKLSPEKPLLLAQCYRENQQLDLAVSALQEALGEERNEDIRISAYTFLMDVLIAQGDFSAAKSCIAQGMSDYPDNNLLKINAARLAYALDKTEVAQANIDPLLVSVMANGNILERVELAELCFNLKYYEKAAQIYESFVDRRANSQFLRQLIGSYYESEKIDKALEIIEGTHRYFEPTTFYAEIEGKIYEDLPDLSKAEAIYEAFLARHADDFRIGLRHANLMYRMGKMEKIDAFLARHDSFSQNILECILAVANLHLVRGNFKQALNITFEARQRYYDNPKAHLNYLHLILMREDDGGKVLDADAVKMGTAVQLNDGAQSKWIHIVPDGEQDLSARRYGASHPMARQMLGQKTGFTFQLDGTLPPTKMTIEEVKSKYLYALHESMELYSELFPGDKNLIRVDMGPMVPGEIPAGLEAVLNDLDQNKAYVESNLQDYYNQQVSVYSLAKMLRKDVIEICFGMIEGRGMRVKCCLGNNEEHALVQHYMDRRDTPLLLDISSIITFNEIGLLDALKAHYSNLYVCQATIEQFRRYAHEKDHESRKGGGTIGKAETGYYIQNISLEVAKAFNDKLLAITAWLEENCSIAQPTHKLTAERQKYANFQLVLGAAAADTIITAASHGLTLLSDDLLLRGIAQQAVGVAGAWSQIALLEMVKYKTVPTTISTPQYLAAVAWMLEADYDFTTFNSASLIWILQQQEWKVTPPFLNILAKLVAQTTDIITGLRVAFYFLIDFWKINTALTNKRNVTFAILNTVYGVSKLGPILADMLINLYLNSERFQPIYGLSQAITDWKTGHFLLVKPSPKLPHLKKSKKKKR